MYTNSIFRPYGPEGSESIQCGDPKCQALNPPEAKFCWICAKRLVPNEVSFGAYDPTEEETADHDLGFEAGLAGKPKDETKSAAWQRGWADAHK
jgi:hypothetical protein